MDHAHSQVACAHQAVRSRHDLPGERTQREAERYTDGAGQSLGVVHSNARAAGNEPTVLLALYSRYTVVRRSRLADPDRGGGASDLPFAETTAATVSPQLRDQAIQLADQMTAKQIERRSFSTPPCATCSGWFCIRQKPMPGHGKARNGHSSADYRVRRAIKLFHEEPAKDLDLNDVARAVGLSRSQFYERFRLCTGLSPRTYLDTLCCERAALLLSDPGIMIGEISDRIGFSAQGHFTRFFKSKTGVSPKSFRMGHIDAGRILK